MWHTKKCKRCGKEYLTTKNGRKYCGECWQIIFWQCKKSNIPVLIKSPK